MVINSDILVDENFTEIEICSNVCERMQNNDSNQF